MEAIASDSLPLPHSQLAESALGRRPPSFTEPRAGPEEAALPFPGLRSEPHGRRPPAPAQVCAHSGAAVPLPRRSSPAFLPLSRSVRRKVREASWLLPPFFFTAARRQFVPWGPGSRKHGGGSRRGPDGVPHPPSDCLLCGRGVRWERKRTSSLPVTSYEVSLEGLKCQTLLVGSSCAPSVRSTWAQNGFFTVIMRSWMASFSYLFVKRLDSLMISPTVPDHPPRATSGGGGAARLVIFSVARSVAFKVNLNSITILGSEQ